MASEYKNNLGNAKKLDDCLWVLCECLDVTYAEADYFAEQ